MQDKGEIKSIMYTALQLQRAKMGIILPPKEWFALTLTNTSAISTQTAVLFDANPATGYLGRVYRWTIDETWFTTFPNLSASIFINGQEYLNGTSTPIIPQTAAQMVAFLNSLGFGTFTVTFNPTTLEYTFQVIDNTNVYGVLSTKSTLPLQEDHVPSISKNRQLIGTSITITTESGTYDRVNSDVNNSAYLIDKIRVSSPAAQAPLTDLLTLNFQDANGVTASSVFSFLNWIDVYQKMTGLLDIEFNSKLLDLSGNTTISFPMQPGEYLKMIFFFIRARKSDPLAKSLTNII